MKKVLHALLLIPSLAISSDYCNGNWSEDAQTYCDGLKTVITTTYIDANMGVPLNQSMEQIPEIVKNYHLPEAFAHNVIMYTYDQVIKDHELSTVAISLEGPCIDNYAELSYEGLKDAAHLYAKEMDNLMNPDKKTTNYVPDSLTPMTK